MTIFWGLAGIMVSVALLFTLPWLLRSNNKRDTDLDIVNTEVIKARLAELEADLGGGRIDEPQYFAAREDLELELLADYADALVMANDRKFTDQAGELLMKALEKEPDNLKALRLAGHWKNQQGEYADAVRYWQRVAGQLPPDGTDAEMIARQISEARAQLAPGEVVEAPTPRQDDTVVAATATGKSITVSVTLDPQLAAGAAPEDTVFIFARAVSGPRMPLAIVRKQVSDLPLTVTLDDSTAMSPAMKLSNFEQVDVGARVSKSGLAMPQSGDLQGLVTPVAPGSGQGIELKIDSRVP